KLTKLKVIVSIAVGIFFFLARTVLFRLFGLLLGFKDICNFGDECNSFSSIFSFAEFNAGLQMMLIGLVLTYLIYSLIEKKNK
ncbi:MAG: hypothetical protein Q8R37_05180, partial [Nanoarchaeota archaeon]|nr:hypothetical protein [Nanoarchaeota archaeon]